MIQAFSEIKNKTILALCLAATLLFLVFPLGTEAAYFEGAINQVPTIITIDGPQATLLGSTKTYDVYTADADGDWLILTIYWGDGMIEKFVRPSNFTFPFTHTWTKRGIYTITVMIDDGKNGILQSSRVMFVK